MASVEAQFFNLFQPIVNVFLKVFEDLALEIQFVVKLLNDFEVVSERLLE